MTVAINVVATTVALAIAGMGLVFGAKAALRPSSTRWQRPPEEPGLVDPEFIMEELIDAIARNPGRARGVVHRGGVKVSAYWITNIEVRPNGAGFTSGYWVLDIDGYQGPCCDLEVLSQVGLARLRAIAAERAAAREADAAMVAK